MELRCQWSLEQGSPCSCTATGKACPRRATVLAGQGRAGQGRAGLDLQHLVHAIGNPQNVASMIVMQSTLVSHLPQVASSQGREITSLNLPPTLHPAPPPPTLELSHQTYLCAVNPDCASSRKIVVWLVKYDNSGYLHAPSDLAMKAKPGRPPSKRSSL